MAAPAPLSPLAPKKYPALPPIGGVRFATIAAGVRYAGRTDVMMALFDERAAVAGVFTRSKCPSAPGGLVSGPAQGRQGAGADCQLRQRQRLHRPRRNERGRARRRGRGQDNWRDVERNLHGLDRRNRRASRWRPHRPRARGTRFGGESRPADGRREGDHDDRHLSQDRHRARQARRGGRDDQRHRQGRGDDRPGHGDDAVVIFTDAPVASGALQTMLSKSVERSFNAITVDSDTSTSDTLMVFATCGRQGRAAYRGRRHLRAAPFRRALDKLTALVTVKTAPSIPIPKARIRTAIALKAGALRN